MSVFEVVYRAKMVRLFSDADAAQDEAKRRRGLINVVQDTGGIFLRRNIDNRVLCTDGRWHDDWQVYWGGKA